MEENLPCGILHLSEEESTILALLGAWVWRYFPYSSEAVLICDPSYWGSLRGDPLCKRRWWF